MTAYQRLAELLQALNSDGHLLADADLLTLIAVAAIDERLAGILTEVGESLCILDWIDAPDSIAPVLAHVGIDWAKFIILAPRICSAVNILESAA